MKIHPNAAAFPQTPFTDPNNRVAFGNEYLGEAGGLTIRAYFAAKAMQGFLSDPNCTAIPERIARISVVIADALIAELNREEEP